MSYEVTWSIEANHAGGYLYRLAPADGPLTEFAAALDRAAGLARLERALAAAEP